MRAYSAASEETVRTRNLLKDWAGEGFLTQAQYHQMEQETGCELRRTNIFLRLVLFLFTLIIVGAAAALIFVILQPTNQQTIGILLLIFSGICYAAAEQAVSQARLYRYGIEESLAVCSVAFLCAGLQVSLFSGPSYSTAPPEAEFLVPAAGAIASLWLWQRFGFHYAFLAAMIFVLWLPGYWTSSQMARHLIVATLYATGLFVVVTARPRYRLTYRNDEYSIAEALLWLGIYLAINLPFSPVNLLVHWWGAPPNSIAFSRPFYLVTWVVTWCLPPVVLARGLRGKDRAVIVVGIAIAILTLVSNKSYLGWNRNSWDPMLLGALLIGVAVFTRRWLANGPSGIRCGFTAQRLSGKDKSWMNIGATAFGLGSQNASIPSPQGNGSDVHFGGGDSGGGGASTKF